MVAAAVEVVVGRKKVNRREDSVEFCEKMKKWASLSNTNTGIIIIKRRRSSFGMDDDEDVTCAI